MRNALLARVDGKLLENEAMRAFQVVSRRMAQWELDRKKAEVNSVARTNR